MAAPRSALLQLKTSSAALKLHRPEASRPRDKRLSKSPVPRPRGATALRISTRRPDRGVRGCSRGGYNGRSTTHPPPQQTSVRTPRETRWAAEVIASDNRSASFPLPSSNGNRQKTSVPRRDDRRLFRRQLDDRPNTLVQQLLQPAAIACVPDKHGVGRDFIHFVATLSCPNAQSRRSIPL